MIITLSVVICAFAQQSADPYKDEVLPHAQKEDVREPRSGEPVAYFRYFSDVEQRPDNEFPRLQNFVKNLHPTKRLIFSWPKTNLAAPTHDPIASGDDKRNARDVPSFRLDDNSPIFYNQDRSMRQASAYVAQAQFPPAGGQKRQTLQSDYEEQHLGPGKLPFRVEVTSYHEGKDGGISVSTNLLRKGGQSFKMGFAVAAVDGKPYFAKSLQRSIETSEIFSWIRPDDLQPDPIYKSGVLMTACGGCSISLRSTTELWEFVSVPMFVQFGENTFAAGVASVYVPFVPK